MLMYMIEKVNEYISSIAKFTWYPKGLPRNWFVEIGFQFTLIELEFTWNHFRSVGAFKGRASRVQASNKADGSPDKPRRNGTTMNS